MINFVPMSTDVAGGTDPLVQALARQQQQKMSTGERLMQAGTNTQTPVYKTGHGLMMLANGALGGFLMGQDERRQEAAARQGAGAAAALAKSMGLSEDQSRQIMAIALTNPEAVGTILKTFTERLNQAPNVHDGFDTAGNKVQRVWDPNTRTWSQLGGAARDVHAVPAGTDLVDLSRRGVPAGAPGAPQAPGAQSGVIYQGARPQMIGEAERQQMIKRGEIQPNEVRPMQRDAAGKISFENPPTQITANASVGANPIMQGVGEQLMEQRKAAAAAADAVRAIHGSRKQIDQSGGIYSGTGADAKLMLAKMFGVDEKTVTNTEAFRSAVGEAVLSRAKTLGANPSDADRKYIQQVAGGEISLNESSLRRILDINENMARGAIDRYNKQFGSAIDAMEKVPNADPGGVQMLRALGPIGMPDPYQAPSAQPALPPAPVPAQPQGAPSVDDLLKKYGPN